MEARTVSILEIQTINLQVVSMSKNEALNEALQSPFEAKEREQKRHADSSEKASS